MSSRSRKIVVETVLTVGALAGVLCVVIAVAGVAFGLTPLVVRSGSMAPTIGVGDVAIARSVPADDVRVGDVVSVTRPDGTRVTHRVTTIDARVGNSTTITLRGDANPVADAEPYTVTSVDRVAFHVPKAGYVLTWFATPFVWALVSLATLALLWVAFRPDKQWRSRHHGRHAAPTPDVDARSVAVQVVAVAVIVASAVTGYARTSGTFAALTDTATATGTVSAIRPTAPTSLSCSNVGASARLSWPNPASNQAYSYRLVFTPRLLGVSGTRIVDPSTANPVTQTFSGADLTTILGLSVLGTYDVELRSKVGNFTSSSRLTITLSVLLGGVSCGSSSGTSSAQAPAAARQAAPSTSSTSSSASSSAPSTSTTTTTPPTTTSPSTTTSPTTTTPQQAAPAGTPSPDGSYVVTVSDGVVVIRTAAGAEEYRGSGASAAWNGPSTLRVTELDGTTTDLTRTDGQWTTASAAPAAATDTTTTTESAG